MNRIIVAGSFALLAALATGCIAQSGDQGSDPSGNPVRHAQLVAAGQAADESAPATSGSSDETDLPFDAHPTGLFEGPHPEPWHTQEGPHPEPWQGGSGTNPAPTPPTDSPSSPSSPGNPGDPSSSHPNSAQQ